MFAITILRPFWPFYTVDKLLTPVYNLWIIFLGEFEKGRKLGGKTAYWYALTIILPANRKRGFNY